MTFAALYLLQRLKTRFIAARGSPGQRLFIPTFMIVSKVICDDPNRAEDVLLEALTTFPPQFHPSDPVHPHPHYQQLPRYPPRSRREGRR
jgi:hypothetical protein